MRFVFPVRKQDDHPFSERITVGRTRTNDIYLPDERISKLHAYFTSQTGEAYALVDVGSRNLHRVNDVDLTPGQAWPVRSGDRVAFGHHLFGFYAPEFRRYVAKLVEGVR